MFASTAFCLVHRSKPSALFILFQFWQLYIVSIQKSIQSLWIFTLCGTVFRINVHMFNSYRHMYTVYKNMYILYIHIYIYTCIIWVVKAPCWNRQGFLRRGLSCILIGRLSWRYHAIELTQTHWRQRRETIQRDDYANTSTQLLSAVHQAAASKAKISRPTWKARPSLLTQFVSAPGISHHLNGRCYGLTTLWGKWQRASPKHSTVTRKAQMPPDDVSKIQCMYKITWARNQNHQDETTSQSVEEPVL